MCEKATGDLRAVQLMEVEMLSLLKDICEKHNLRYFVDFGSLLGAARHKGFIPWDDDIDVTMPYEDYVRFLEIAPKELSEDYFFQTIKNEPTLSFPFSKIRRNGTRMTPLEEADWDIHQGVWIDIFPIVETNGGLEFLCKRILVKSYWYFLSDYYASFHKKEYMQRFKPIGMFILKLIFKIPREKRLAFFDKMLNKFIYPAKNKKYNAVVWCSLSNIVPKDIYEESCMVEFEGKLFHAPKKYHERLTLSYGDYMQLPPVEKRIGHAEEMLIDLNHGKVRTN